MAETVAADSLCLFSGNPNADDEERMMRLGENYPAYRKELLKATRLLADLEDIASDGDIQNVLMRYSAQPTHSRRRWRVWAMAATILIALTVGFFRYQLPVSSDSQIDRYVTRVGEQKEITLTDGSRITLNTGTSLMVEMSGELRRVILERGEAYFQVAGDAQRPFRVDLGERSISVLGTAFNVLKSPDRFTMAVIEGTVAIHAREDNVSNEASLLKPVDGQVISLAFPGQRKVTAGTIAEYDYDSKELLAYADPNVASRQQWRSGMLVFENVPLGEVVQELNRYSGKKILLESSALMDRKIYAVVRVDRLSNALMSLQNTVPIKVVTHFDRIVIYDRKK